MESGEARIQGRAGGRLGSAAVALVLLAGMAYFGKVVHAHYPIQQWLVWHYAGMWLGVLVVLAGAYGLGHVLVRRALGLRLPLLEHAITAFAVGVFGYEILVFLAGIFQLYRAPTFFALPLGLLAAVSVPLARHLAHVRRVLSRASRRAPRLGTGAILALAFGCLGLGLLYVNVLTPQNVQFDARWKHMAIAEDYVLHGGIHPSAEGWVFSARPHFSSYLYTWAFLLPKARLFDRMVLAAHLEFAAFLFTTVVGIPALVRRLVRGADPRWIWAVRFLFPGVLLYDSSVSGGADHLGAMVAVPIALCTFRVLRDFDPRRAALLGVLAAGAALTKETVAIMLVPFPALALLVQSIRAARSNRRALLGPLVFGLAALVATSPLWLKNFVFYGDPVYPLSHRFLNLHPFSEDAAYRFQYGYLEGKMWAPTRDLAGLAETASSLWLFSFLPNDWGKFHGDVPVFGSLFTLLLPALLLVRVDRRVWFLVAWIHVAIFAWYSVHHQDRYLQGQLPLMTAVTAVLLLSLYRSFGRPTRAALFGLVGLQVVWGGDVYFIQTHVHAKSPPKQVIDLVSGGFDQKYTERFAVQARFQTIGAEVPPGSRLLLHLMHVHHGHLGTGHRTVLDNYLWQFGIEYGRAGSPEGVRKRLRELGVTHAFVAPEKESDGSNSIAADILFWEFAQSGLAERRVIEGGVLGRVTDTPITAPFHDAALLLGCTKDAPPRGLYHVNDLHILPYGPKALDFPAPEAEAATKEAAERLIPAAEYVILEKQCYEQKPTALLQGFELLVERRSHGAWKKLEIWSRKR
ncbi:hypothetical protein [Polyangium mundeleinium]|uniref:Glycosyltransferase RgtA/B/C/D-like domain-containing protein n=1 Tax=Polyangium mundeleinium TaxID=2995306 RepID=A0ABT5EGY1_9BACT|nr:hypothetical protein [Polyangium mundeleinium]MDC0741021.1 hypothetical protein [Polyangium mundeleinium]